MSTINEKNKEFIITQYIPSTQKEGNQEGYQHYVNLGKDEGRVNQIRTKNFGSKENPQDKTEKSLKITHYTNFNSENFQDRQTLDHKKNLKHSFTKDINRNEQPKKQKVAEATIRPTQQQTADYLPSSPTTDIPLQPQSNKNHLDSSPRLSNVKFNPNPIGSLQQPVADSWKTFSLNEIATAIPSQTQGNHPSFSLDQALSTQTHLPAAEDQWSSPNQNPSPYQPQATQNNQWEFFSLDDALAPSPPTTSQNYLEGFRQNPSPYQPQATQNNQWEFFNLGDALPPSPPTTSQNYLEGFRQNPSPYQPQATQNNQWEFFSLGDALLPSPPTTSQNHLEGFRQNPSPYQPQTTQNNNQWEFFSPGDALPPSPPTTSQNHQLYLPHDNYNSLSPPSDSFKFSSNIASQQSMAAINNPKSKKAYKPNKAKQGYREGYRDINDIFHEIKDAVVIKEREGVSRMSISKQLKLSNRHLINKILDHGQRQVKESDRILLENFIYNKNLQIISKTDLRKNYENINDIFYKIQDAVVIKEGEGISRWNISKQLKLSNCNLIHRILNYGQKRVKKSDRILLDEFISETLLKPTLPPQSKNQGLINIQSLESLTQKLGVEPEPWEQREQPNQLVSRIYGTEAEAWKVANAVARCLDVSDIIGVVPTRKADGFRVVITDVPRFADALNHFTPLLENCETMKTTAASTNTSIELTKEELKRAEELLDGFSTKGDPIAVKVLLSRFPSFNFAHPLDYYIFVAIKPGEKEGSYLMTTYSGYLPPSERDERKKEELVSATDIRFILKALERKK